MAAIAAALIVVAGTTGAANPDRATDKDGHAVKVVKVKHLQGWSEEGRTDVTVTEATNPDGTGSGEAGGGVSVAPAAASARTAARAAAAKVGQPVVTWEDVQAYATTPLEPGEVDQGPQPDSDGVVTYYRAAAPKSTAKRSDRAANVVADPMATGNGGLPAYDCTGVLDFSDNDVHFKSCAYYNFKYKSHGHTYFSVRGAGTAWATDDNCNDCDRITKFGAWDDLDNKAGYIYDWAPTGTNSIGSCKTKTVSATATAGGASATVSNSQEVCPEQFGNYTGKFTDSSTGSLWEKKGGATVPKDAARGAHYVQLADWNRAYTLYMAAHGWVQWD
jgi:hypothetical protein